MKYFILFILLFGWSLLHHAQDFTILNVREESGLTVAKVKFSTTVDYNTEYAFEMKNPDGTMFYANLPYSSYEELTAGSTKEITLQSSGPSITTSTKMYRLGTTSLLNAQDRFEASFLTAFIGDAGYFATTFEQVKGSVKVGDRVTVTDEDNRLLEVTIKAIELSPATGSVINLNGVDERFRIGNGFGLTFFFETDSGKGPGGKFTMKAGSGPVAGTPESAQPTVFKGNREVVKKNVVLTDGKLKITLNALVKYHPSENDSPLKMDLTLDYYILDVTVENVSGEVIDAGEYMIHLNLYDGAVVNSDDHGRLFRNSALDAETQEQVDAIDINLLGGTSSIRYAVALTAYSSMDPEFSSENCNAVYGKLQPGEKLRCSALKAIGVPKTYVPVEIGFWLTDVRKPVKVRL
jgi:hypothetical protein